MIHCYNKYAVKVKTGKKREKKNFAFKKLWGYSSNIVFTVQTLEKKCFLHLNISAFRLFVRKQEHVELVYIFNCRY